MSRTLLLGILLFFIVIAGLATFNGPLLELAIPVMLYLLIGLWRGPDPLALNVERHISSERVSPGQEFTVTLSITNHGGRLAQVTFVDPLPRFLQVTDGSATRVTRLAAGETFTWSYTLRGSRGFFAFNHLYVHACDPFGLSIARETLSTAGQVLVLPPVPRLRRIVIRPRVTRVYSGNIPARQGGPGIDFFGVREYQPGDPTRWINWRVSARHHESVFANEFEQERVADVGIILDGRKRLNEFRDEQSLFEHSILAAASLADAFLVSGNRVGLLVYGKYINWHMPGYGKSQRERILQALARAETGDSQAFSGITIPPQMFPTRSQLVFVSPLDSDDLAPLLRLRALGYSLIVVSPDPLRFELSLLQETHTVHLSARILRLQRQVLLQRLQHGGVQIVDWNTSHPFDQVAGPLLSRSPAFMRAIGAGGGHW